MKIFISNKAKYELYLHSFYKSKYNKQTAEKFLNDFNSSIQSLVSFPYMYPKLSFNNSYRKLIFNKKYVIIYTIENDIIYIDSVVNCKQNYITF